MWQLLPGRHWPMLTEQETTFVARISELAAGQKAKAERDDLIMLLTALRCGTDADLLLEHAPGTSAASLLASYNWIDTLRDKSMKAWLSIEQTPSMASVDRHAPEAVKLLPIPVRRVVATIEGIASGHTHPGSLAETIAEVSAQVHKTKVRAHGFESELDRILNAGTAGLSATEAAIRANDIGQRLYDPLTPGIYGDSYYLADRVSTLSPLRVRDLLGERHVHTQLLL